MMFDSWSDAETRELLATATSTPSISVLVFDSGSPVALAATMESITAQVRSPEAVLVARTGTALDTIAGDYVAVLQAGEVLAPHALLVMADEATRTGLPDILTADEDEIAPGGERERPLFKPRLNDSLIHSGTLSRGAWVIRAPLVQAIGQCGWAEALRLRVWFDGATRVHHVPYILTHRRPDTAAAPASLLADLVSGALSRQGVAADVTPSFPLRVQRHPTAPVGRVSIIVPSTCRSPKTLACLTGVLETTRYPDFEIVVVISQDTPLDAAQRDQGACLRRDPRVRVEVLSVRSFNYSQANNFAAGLTAGPFLCLLNDDVTPIAPEWLDRMLSFFTDPRVGIVGARLYYPDDTTQHGGIIIGLAGLCEHANRNLPRGEPGYADRAILDQELSAVTGACLLVRRSLFDTLGGLDESFASAFNDVDFCLRARDLDHTIVFAACAELYHYETITYGRHYGAEEAGQEARDIARLRARWAELVRADPFHNVNLSLRAGHEWELAFPPRRRAD